MHKVIITLDESAMLELQSILLDEDEKAALAFLQERVLPQIPKKGKAPCDSSRLNPYL